MLASLRLGLHTRSAVDVLTMRLARYNLPNVFVNDLQTDLWLALSPALSRVSSSAFARWQLPICIIAVHPD